MTHRKKIAIAFYGISRSLSYTAPSIHDKLINPTRAFGDCVVFCHFYDQRVVCNPRTQEQGQLNPDEWRLLHPDIANIAPLELDREQKLLEALKPFGNAWEDDWNSLQNILRQLLSLQHATHMISTHGNFDYVVLARPDMEYHDAIDWPRLTKVTTPTTVVLPHWQWSGGLNDRLAVCGNEAFQYYGNRIDMATRFCRDRNRPLHSERLLFYTLMNSPTWLRTMSTRATRIRSNGQRASESFARVKIAKIVEAFLACNAYPRFKWR